MKISNFKINLVSDKLSWINEYIPGFVVKLQALGHKTCWVHTAIDLEEADIAFYLGCGQMIPPSDLKKNKHNLVVHESDLPHGKGWSPLTWQILEGKNRIPIVLFEAEGEMDSGPIYLKRELEFKGTELIDEMREQQAMVTFNLCIAFLKGYPDILKEAQVQKGKKSFYPRRSLEDSRLDPDKTLREQFNLLRVVDNEKYPAFFDINGEKHILTIKKAEQK